MLKKLIAAVLLAGVAAGSAAEFNTIPVKLPEKYLAGYSGYELGAGMLEAFTENYLEPMRKAGFNNIDLKIFQVNPGNRLDLKNPAVFNELAALILAANERGLLFTAYVFTEPYQGKRNVAAYPQHAKLTAFVDEEGKTVENLFSIIDYDVLRELYNNAYELAEASRKLPIGAVKFDIENIFNFGVSFDDKSWTKFCADYPQFQADTPPAKRAAALEAAGFTGTYKDWFALQFEATVKRIADELHAINPDLSLGLMPTDHGWVSRAFAKHLATPRAPAFMDDWCMYGSDGYDREFVQKRQAELKALNPNNLYVGWIRLNSHLPEDLPSQLYSCAMETDGYNVWAMHMIDPAFKESGYELPNGKSIADYYDNFAVVNRAVRAKSPIEYKKLDAGIQPLDLNVRIPALIPYGNGTGPTPGFIMRDQQTAYIYAETGEMIRATVTHVSGTARKVAIQYALLDKDGNKLRNEIVLPGDETRFGSESFAVAAPYTGVYALTLSGGTGGLAWYGLQIHNRHYAFEVIDRGNAESPGVYLFYSGGSFDVYFLRDGMTGPAAIVGEKREGMVFDYRFGDGPATMVEALNYRIPLPPEQVIKMTFSLPAKLKQTQYMQDFIFVTEGAVVPYIYDNPERALVPPR